jgi:hypothetical protein
MIIGSYTQESNGFDLLAFCSSVRFFWRLSRWVAPPAPTFSSSKSACYTSSIREKRSRSGRSPPGTILSPEQSSQWPTMTRPLDSGVRYLIVDLPADKLLQVADAPRDAQALVFNGGAPDESVRTVRVGADQASRLALYLRRRISSDSRRFDHPALRDLRALRRLHYACRSQLARPQCEPIVESGG